MLKQRTMWEKVSEKSILKAKVDKYMGNEENAIFNEILSRRNRVYISGGITGVDYYMDHFNKAEEDLCLGIYRGEYDFTSIVNPAKINLNCPTDFNHDEYMSVSLVLLSMCDSIYMLSGWRESKGAVEEFCMAKSKGMTIYYEHEGSD